jgi:6-phosphogluconate dehydrogenase
MREGLRLTAPEMQTVFAQWNGGALNSYLIEITAAILAKTDPETGRPMVDVILDAAGQKGTGKWTAQAGLDLGVGIPQIAEAVFARCLSAVKDERVAASGLLKGPRRTFRGDRARALANLHDALYAAKICSYAQGFQLLRVASREYGWDLRCGEIAAIWRAGCVIRAQFLDRIREAFDLDPQLANLLLDPCFRRAVSRAQSAWRRSVGAAVGLGLPVPALGAALSYYDAYRSERLPANLLQAQRDYFGAHTYERVDQPRGRFFHTDWTGSGGKTAATTYVV